MQLRTISLGWGVQSFGLAAMSALGVLPRVDYAIFADTSWERAPTYNFALRWSGWLERHGVKVVTVRAKESVVNAMLDDSHGQTHVPLYTISEDGSWGQLRRSCTHRWKIYPIRRWLSAELKRRGLKKRPGIVEQWIGFTLDEAHRVSPDSVQYVESRYPYLEMLDRPYTRHMVIRWLRECGLEVPVKSSCIFCPFHSYHEWRIIQLNQNGDWGKAAAVDRAIRNKRPGYQCFLCDDRRPLEEHDFTMQLSLW
jgi:hypothetical protein